MFELNAETGYRDRSIPQYARWSVFDRQRQAKEPCCWLDRRTGRLLYLPQHADPNAARVVATPV